MSQVTLGEDIFGVMVAVGLISVFVVVWGSSFATYRKYNKGFQESQFLLSVSNFVINGSHPDVRSEPALIRDRDFRKQLADFFGDMRSCGEPIRVSVTSLQDATLFRSGETLDGSTRSVSFPVVYVKGNERFPVRLIVETEV